MGWGILALLAGVGAVVWIFSPSPGPAHHALPEGGDGGGQPERHDGVSSEGDRGSDSEGQGAREGS